MKVSLRESLFISTASGEYIVRKGATGVRRSGTLFFYDNTKTVAVGFSQQDCEEDHFLFQVARTLDEPEIPMRDVVALVDRLTPEELQRPNFKEILKERLNSL